MDNSKYPQRLSIDELRTELTTYIAERQQTKEPATVDLDRRKVEYFLTWLDGSLKAQR